MRRLAIFCHFDKNNLIDDYIVTYLQGLKSVAHDIQFVSHSFLNHHELKKIEPYVQKITLRKNIGLDFGAWQEIIASLGLSYIAEHYDQLILANDSCYGPFSPFSELFIHMSKKSFDMWGITENREPHYVRDDGSILNIPPHIQSYFLVFNKTVLQSPCFYTFWENVKNLNSRDTVILEREVGLTQFLQKCGFSCGAFITSQAVNMNKLKSVQGEQLYDLSLFYWYKLLEQHSPLLKVKAIPATLELNKKDFQKFKKNYQQTKELCSFSLVDKHLKRTSIAYQITNISLLKRIILVVEYLAFRKTSNTIAIEIIKKYQTKFLKNYAHGGVRQVAKKIYRIILHKLSH